LIIYLLTFPVFAIQETQIPGNVSSLETIENFYEEESKNEELAPQEDLPIKYKEPSDYKKTLKSFIIAMLCVAGTSIFLYGTLSLYNKFRNRIYNDLNLFQESDSPLETPQDISEAVRSFIDKTRWN